MNNQGSIALVTGASSGIGEATAKRLALAGYKVYGTSRRGASPGQRSFEMLSLDVTRDESVEAAVAKVIRLDGRIDHELRTRGIRVSVIEPAYTKTQFDAHLLEADSKLEEYRAVRTALGRKLRELLAAADEPGIVADVVLQAATAARPKLRYTAGRVAGRVRWLRRFAPARLLDSGIRKGLQLDASSVA